MRWWTLGIAMIALAMSSVGGNARAQDEKKPEGEAAAPAAEAAADASVKTGDEAAAPKQATNRLQWIYEAEGIFFFPQLLMSVIIIAMIVMYGMQATRAEFLPPKFVEDLDALLKDRRHQEAYELAKGNPSVVARVVTAGMVKLAQPGANYSQAVEAMQEVGEDDGMKYDHRLSYLAMMANIATMVGLLGTVWGMVASFMVIAASDATPKPSELAQGVSQALVTTVWGLLQAIPAIIGHTILKNRISRMMLEVGITSERLINRVVNAGAPAAKKAASSTEV